MLFWKKGINIPYKGFGTAFKNFPGKIASFEAYKTIGLIFGQVLVFLNERPAPAQQIFKRSYCPGNHRIKFSVFNVFGTAMAGTYIFQINGSRDFLYYSEFFINAVYH